MKVRIYRQNNNTYSNNYKPIDPQDFDEILAFSSIFSGQIEYYNGSSIGIKFDKFNYETELWYHTTQCSASIYANRKHVELRYDNLKGRRSCFPILNANEIKCP